VDGAAAAVRRTVETVDGERMTVGGRLPAGAAVLERGKGGKGERMGRRQRGPGVVEVLTFASDHPFNVFPAKAGIHQRNQAVGIRAVNAAVQIGVRLAEGHCADGSVERCSTTSPVPS
jgi:hypothetical protein